MDYTNEMMEMCVELVKELSDFAERYNTTVDDIFTNMITLSSEIIEWRSKTWSTQLN